LDQGGVGECGEKSQSFIDGGSGSVEFFLLGFVGLVVLLSDEYDFREGLSVLFLVALEVGDSLSQLGSSGEEEVVEQVFSPIDIDGGVLDVLLQLDHHGIVLVGPHVEVELQLLQSVVQVRQQFLDGIKQLLHGTLSHGMELNQVQEGVAVARFRQLSHQLA